jgi:hypothetical protein
MKPAFLTQMEEAFAVRQHAILTLNTEDRFYFPEENVGPSNLNYFLASYFSSHGYRVAQYAPTLGVRELSPAGSSSSALERLSSRNEPVEILNGLTTLLRNPQERWVVIVLHAESVAPRQGAGVTGSQEGIAFAEILHTLALDDGIAKGPSRLVLITYSGLPDDLIVRSRGYRLIDVGLPGEDERKAFVDFLERLHNHGQEGFGRLEEGLEPGQLVRMTAGMPLSGIEAAFRAASHLNQPVGREQLRAIKARDIRNLAHDLIEVSEPQSGFEAVAGLGSVKSYFNNLIPHIREGRPGVPQAILFQGVPGCGKSHLVKALACELNWPLLELRNVRSPYVGQSEMNLDHVIRVVEQLQPAVLFFDEIDQSLGQRGTGVSGDSGTSERMLARIFNWLGSLHLRGRVLFVGATNRPDILDPALLDRFGVSIPFLKPGAEELEELVPLLLRQFGLALDGLSSGEVAELLMQHSLTGRSCQEILISAGQCADRTRGGMGAAIGNDHLYWAMNDHIMREDPVEMEFIALVALSLASFQSLLPWNGFDGLRANAMIPERFLQLGVVGSDGRIDRGKLQDMLQELKQRRHAERMMR